MLKHLNILTLVFLFSLGASCPTQAQSELVIEQQQNNRKGTFYCYWGWNRGWFSQSNINFKGADYDFTVKKVLAKDRQSPFNFDTYFNPSNLSVPQFNFRLGYFIKENYSISIGTDHMKYIMLTNQTVKIKGHIFNSQTEYDGTYNDDFIILGNQFLSFEHTDGLNYINTDVRRFDELFSFKKVSVNLTEGLGFGFLLPRTNTQLLGKERYDQFHLSGFGLSAVVGVNVLFFKHFFIQSEFKTGYINMPSVRTTNSNSDSAKQSFFFSQLNILFGASFGINRN